MLKKMLLVSAAVVLLGGGCLGGTTVTPPPVVTPPVTTGTEDVSDLIYVTTDLSLPVKSPLTVKGEARGTWYSEAVFPVIMTDSLGKEVGRGQAHADGDWMTEDFVPFTVTVVFSTQPAGSPGFLILKNDNPSGDPARDKSLKLPVTF